MSYVGCNLALTTSTQGVRSLNGSIYKCSSFNPGMINDFKVSSFFSGYLEDFSSFKDELIEVLKQKLPTYLASSIRGHSKRSETPRIRGMQQGSTTKVGPWIP